jgi:Tripartite tricarboxylate transporter TctB family
MKRPSGRGSGSGLTLAFIALVILMLAAAAGLSRVSGWIPLVVLSATLLLLLWQLAVEVLAARQAQVGDQGSDQAGAKEGDGWTAFADPRDRRAAAAIAWIGLLLLLSWLAGVIAGTALFSLAWLRGHARERWAPSLAQAAGLALVLWLVFGPILGSGLYPGVLWPLLG